MPPIPETTDILLDLGRGDASAKHLHKRYVADHGRKGRSTRALHFRGFRSPRGDSGRIERLRVELRESMRSSDLLDSGRACAELEGAYRTMWTTWCAGSTDD